MEREKKFLHLRNIIFPLERWGPNSGPCTGLTRALPLSCTLSPGKGVPGHPPALVRVKEVQIVL